MTGMQRERREEALVCVSEVHGFDFPTDGE